MNDYRFSMFDAEVLPRCLGAGITFFAGYAVAGICDRKGGEVAEIRCKGNFDPTRPSSNVALVHKAIDVAIHRGSNPIDYDQIVSILVSSPHNMDEMSARDFAVELKYIEPRLRNTQIEFASDIEVIMQSVLQNGNGLIISGSPDLVFGQNRNGKCVWMNGRDFESNLVWEAMNIITGNMSKASSFMALQSRFLDHFSVRNTDDLKAAIGFDDPIERPSIKTEVLSIVANSAAEGNALAFSLCAETTRRYVAWTAPAVTDLGLTQEVFPINLHGGLFTINPIFKRVYLNGLKHLAPNAYLAEDKYKMGISEARMSLDRFFNL